MNFLKNILIWFVLSYAFVKAQDTLSYKTKELVVVDTITQDIMKYNGTTYRTIHLTQAKRMNIENLLNSIPLINLTQYGGMGSLTTIGIRGASSNQTIISINQIPLNNSANPFFDINLLPSELIDQVDIISVGNSSIFGSGSIGGNINFGINKNQIKSIQTAYSIGSFGYYKVSLSHNNMISIFPNLSNSVSYETYSGNYPIKYNEFGTIIDTFRTNSEYKSLKLSSFFTYPIAQSFLYNSTFLLSFNNQQQPGAVLIGRLEESNTYLKYGSLISLNKLSYTHNYYELYLNNISSIKKYNYNNSNNLMNSNSDFTSFDISNKVLYKHRTSINGSLNMELGWDYNQLAGNMIQKDIGAFVNRHLFSIAGSFNQIIDLLPLSYNLAVRLEKSSDLNSIAKSGSFSVNYFLYDNLKLNYTISNNYRFPSFNEMYYFNYGNTNLLPEKALSNELSIEYNNNNIMVQLFGFVNNINDKIVSVPKSTLSWSAQNFSKVLNYGTELNLQIPLYKDLATIFYNYIIQKALDNNPHSKYYKNIIPYIPIEQFSLSLETKYSNFMLNMNLQRKSYRYFLPENINENLLPSYTTINGIIQYSTTLTSEFSLYIALNINNLTNLNYEIVKNYPMPTRSIIITFWGRYEKANL